MRATNAASTHVDDGGHVTLRVSRRKTSSNGLAGSRWPSSDRADPRCTEAVTTPTTARTTTMSTHAATDSASSWERLIGASG